jgi:aspartate kinase
MKLVMKFGGASVADGKRIRKVGELVKAFAPGNQLAVVVSAMNHVTNSLLRQAEEAGRGRREGHMEFINDLWSRHTNALRESVRDGGIRESTLRLVEGQIDELDKVLTGISHIGELTPRSKDYVLSFGERLTAPILSAVLRDMGVKATPYTGGEAGIVTDDRFGEANPLMNLTTHQVSKRLKPLMEASVVPVVSGFIAVTQSGAYTTLGRGASDFTASILGVALRADEVWVWKDVDGVMTADPDIAPDARVMPEISFAEAIEMAHFGAAVIHPRALELAEEHGVPFRVKNTFAPDAPGTLITREKHVTPGSVVKATSIIEEVGLITISGARLSGSPRVAVKVLDILSEVEVDVLLMAQSSSEANITLAVPRGDLDRAANALELALLGSGLVKEITAEADLSIAAIVGAGMKGTPGVAARLFSAVARKGINVRAIAQGSSELNISFVVRKDQAREAVRTLHDEFGLAQAGAKGGKEA